MNPYCVLFPAFVHGLREPDPEFFRETSALEVLSISWRVVDIDALTRGDLEKALQFFGEPPPEPLLYRGWILSPREYSALSKALRKRGCRLFTSPIEYRNGLLFPRFFPAIRDHSIPAVWITGKNPDCALAAAEQLGPPPYFIKDHAKSAKEIWPEGCVVDSAKSMPSAIKALADYRGERFEGGVVIRPLVRLRYLDEGAFGGKVFEEYRMFFFMGTMISKTAYDRTGGDGGALPDYRFLGDRVRSRFFSADAVVTEDGQPLLLELGDGGASSLPPNLSPLDFHHSILRVLSDQTSLARNAPPPRLGC